MSWSPDQFQVDSLSRHPPANSHGSEMISHLRDEAVLSLIAAMGGLLAVTSVANMVETGAG